ncbi:MAG: hypothetical protein ABS965_07820, partial [Succiniclasticum sp.]
FLSPFQCVKGISQIQFAGIAVGEESQKKSFELYGDQQMSSELYAVRQKKSSRHETYCILPQCV